MTLRHFPENPALDFGKLYGSRLGGVRLIGQDRWPSTPVSAPSKRNKPGLANTTKDQHGALVHAGLA